MRLRIKRRYLGLTYILLLLGSAAFLGALFTYSPLVGGQLGVNDTAITKVIITNSEPRIYQVTVTPNPVDLTAANVTQVFCNASVFDFEGWDDLNFTNATIFAVGTDLYAADDNNNHYSNSSCAVCSQISSQNASCGCTFEVEYYADNTTWTCNISVMDDGNLNATNWTDFSVNELIAIEVPSEIDFGSLAVTQISSIIEENISNEGNVEINITLYGFEGTNISASHVNHSMECTLGNITRNDERFSLNGSAAFNDMTPINSTPYDINLNVSQRTNDSGRFMGEDVNVTFWRLRVPLSVGGVCNGTVVFTAQATP